MVTCRKSRDQGVEYLERDVERVTVDGFGGYSELKVVGIQIYRLG